LRKSSEKNKNIAPDIVGVALSPKQEFIGMISVDEQSEEWVAMKFFIEQLYNKLEREALALEREKHPQLAMNEKYKEIPVSEYERRKVPLTIDVLCRTESRFGGKTLYYFETWKRYSEKVESGVPVLAGYFVQNREGNFSFVDLNFKIYDIVYWPTAKVYGVVGIGSQYFLIIRRVFYATEDYYIDKIGPKFKNVIITSGPGC